MVFLNFVKLFGNPIKSTKRYLIIRIGYVFLFVSTIWLVKALVTTKLATSTLTSNSVKVSKQLDIITDLNKEILNEIKNQQEELKQQKKSLAQLLQLQNDKNRKL